MMRNDIITEVINDYLGKKTMLREYKNPNDGETVKVCADMLENLYNNIISNGVSRNEYTVQQLFKIIHELRKLQETIR